MIVIAETCPYCQRARSPRDMRKLAGGARICDVCRVNHESAVLSLSGLKANGDGSFTTSAPPPLECSECGISAHDLNARQGLGDKRVTFSVIYEGGIYRYFCPPCADLYETKRREFFKNTAYAKQRGLA